MRKLYLIVGASGTGKDYITDKLCKEFNMRKVISRTTRKPRYEGESTHKFVSNSQADNEFNYAIAKTVFNGNRYYTLLEDIIGADFYIIDPKGVESVSDGTTEYFNFQTIFIKTNWFTRARNMRKRGDSYKAIITRLINDYKAFKGFTAEVNFTSSDEFYNYISDGKNKK